MIENIKFDYVDATLKHGQVFSSKVWRALIIFFYVLMSIVLSICIIYLTVVPLTVGVYSQGDLLAMICSCIFSVIFLIGVIIFHKCYNSRKRNVEMWLKDSILLKAKSTSIGQRLVVRNFIALTGFALEVSFMYDDMCCTRRSERDSKLVFLPVYRKYANKVITIAYSPKYDEVILIKPEFINKIGNER